VAGRKWTKPKRQGFLNETKKSERGKLLLRLSKENEEKYKASK